MLAAVTTKSSLSVGIATCWLKPYTEVFSGLANELQKTMDHYADSVPVDCFDNQIQDLLIASCQNMQIS